MPCSPSVFPNSASIGRWRFESNFMPKLKSSPPAALH